MEVSIEIDIAMVAVLFCAFVAIQVKNERHLKGECNLMHSICTSIRNLFFFFFLLVHTYRTILLLAEDPKYNHKALKHLQKPLTELCPMICLARLKDSGLA